MSHLLETKRSSLWRRLVHGLNRTWQRRDWARFAGGDWAKTIMSSGLTDDCHAKQGRSTGRWVMENDGGRLAVYVKRHYELPWWSGLLTVLCPWRNWSPAVQELRNLEWAQDHGLPVPAPVAAGEFVGPWGKMQSVLAVEELRDMICLHTAIPEARKRLDARTFRRWKQGLIAEVARLARELHAQRHFHKDLYLCHFFIARDDIHRTKDWRGRVFLIDFHRLGRHALTWPVWVVKDLGQLMYSSYIEGVDARDRLRFWRCYQKRPHAGRSLLARLIHLKGNLYYRHNAKHKTLEPAAATEGPRS